MKLNYLFLFVFLLFAQNVFSQVDKGHLFAAAKLQAHVDSINIYIDKNGRDAIFYSVVEEFEKDFVDYKKQYGADSSYLITSIMIYEELIPHDPKNSFDQLFENASHADALQLLHIKQLTLHKIASLYYTFGAFDEAIKIYNQGSLVFKELEDWGAYAYALIDIGNIYYQNHKGNIAIIYYDKARDVFGKFENESDKNNGLAVYWNNIGLVKLDNDEWQEAEQCFREAIKHRSLAGNYAYLSLSNTYLANCKKRAQQYDSVNYYLAKAVALDSAHQMVESWVYSLINYGVFYANYVHDNRIADSIFQIGLSIAQEHNFPSGEAELCNMLGRLSYVDTNIQQANAYFQRGFDLAVSIGDNGLKERLLSGLILVSKTLKDYEKLSQYLEQKQQFLEARNSDNSALSSQVSYEVKMRLLEEEQYQAKLKAAQQRITFTVVISVFFVMIAVVVFMLYSSNRRKGQMIQTALNDLKEATEKKDLIYSVIAHDLKGPLASVNQVLYLILTDSLEPQKMKELIGAAQQSTTQTYTLLKNLLEWARMEQGKLEFAPEEINLNTLVQECMNLLHLQLQAKEMVINIESEEEIVMQGDKNMLFTIVSNILSNAIKYSYQEGEIDVLLQKETNQVKVKVIDYGVGIHEDRLKQLFDSNVFETTKGTQNESGTGFGLKITKQFVECHNGQLLVMSSVGEGSIFELIIPQ